MITVTKRFKFEAAHFLPYYDGACANMHGHSYHLDVTVSGDLCTDTNNPKCGMIIDFKDLKALVNNIVGKYDHSVLNEYYTNPTAELMVEDIGQRILEELTDKGLYLVSVKLWETETSYAEYTPRYLSVTGLKSAT